METPYRTAPVVVIVDDDPCIRDMLKDHIEMNGFVCRCHGSAEEYLASKDLPETDCLIVDATLPTMDGLELQRQVIEAGHRFPIIFNTGQLDSRLETRARKAGAVDFLEKAASPAHLIHAINRALMVMPWRKS